MRNTICNECQRELPQSFRGLVCRTCKPQSKHNTCDCGASISYRSKKCRSCNAASRTRENHPLWRGGRNTTSKGYILVKDSTTTKNSGYSREHVLVMEQHIGRKLLPGETVHHINGIRNDNRLENLELWTKPQPYGIRAIDLLMWAREVIETYGPIEVELSGAAPES